MMIIEKSRMKYLLGSKSISVRRTRRLKVDRLIGGRSSLLVPPRTTQGMAASGRHSIKSVKPHGLSKIRPALGDTCGDGVTV